MEVEPKGGVAVEEVKGVGRAEKEGGVKPPGRAPVEEHVRPVPRDEYATPTTRATTRGEALDQIKTAFRSDAGPDAGYGLGRGEFRPDIGRDWK